VPTLAELQNSTATHQQCEQAAGEDAEADPPKTKDHLE